jgi:hypothetical protein
MVSPTGATGTVQFLDGTTALGSAAVAGGSASLTLSTLTVGTHPISVIYGGDASTSSSTSATLVETIDKATTTSVISSSTNQTSLGQTIDIRVTVTPSTATGTVQLLDGTAVLGTGSFVGGVALFGIVLPTAGTHSITAVYGGDANNNASTSTPIVVSVSKGSSTVAVTSLTNPSIVGQPLIFSAKISPAMATGTVQIFDGATPLGTATIGTGSGSALLVATIPTAGAHSITGVYSGDGNYTASTSDVLALTVNKAASNLALASSANPAAFGQPVTITAQVTPVAATGTVQFLAGATVLGTATIASGSASLAVGALAVGAHSITAVYSGDANVATSASATLSQTVNKAVSSATLTSSVNPSSYGQSVTFTVAVTPSAATGTVQFLDGVTSLGTATVAGGSASLEISSLAAGAHSITAVYSGDANDVASNSAAVAQTVNKLAVGVSLASSAKPSTYGQSVTFRAAVSPAAATGTVQFLDGTTSLGTVTVAGGSASLAISTLAVGAHFVTAVYSGDANDLTSTSAALAPTVNEAASSVTLASSANPSSYGPSVTFRATVSPAAATGTVQFLDGATSLGTVTIAGGSASLAISTLAVGAHSITAVYSGDASYTVSTSAALAQTADKAASSVALTSSLNPSTAGQSVTFTATVSPSAATGTVQFLNGTTSLGTVTLAGGKASLALSTLASSVHSITAVYGGATDYATSTSAALSQAVLPDAPPKLTATSVSSTQIDLAWTPSPTNGVTYSVYSSATSGFTPSASDRIASGLTVGSYSNTGLSASTIHYYIVTAQNSAGESDASNQASATTPGGPGCHVTYSVTSQWAGGFGTAITIQNTGSTPISNWNLTWNWPGNQTITQSWNAVYTQKGANATLTYESYNATIAPGAIISGIGFNASYGGTNTDPSAFSVNGTLCN